MGGRLLAACACTVMIAGCASTTVARSGPATTAAAGAPALTAPWVGPGLRVVLRACAPAGTTPPPCDGTELQDLLAALRVPAEAVRHVRTCWGDPPRNYEDIEARDVVVGPIPMTLPRALAAARADRDVASAQPVPLPYHNPECAAP